MSRSNNTELHNPATKFYSWNGDKGGFRYYDKEADAGKDEKGNEKKGLNIEVPLPFRFLVLDCISTIKGFSDADQSGFWSNEIRDIKKEEFVVRNKKGICAKGLYENVINDRNCNGARYVQSIYIATKEGDKLVIANVQMIGAALSAWIEFRKKNKIYEGAIAVDSMIEGKKGKTVYQIPVFSMLPVTQTSNDAAMALDKELQQYLTLYFAKNSTMVVESHVEEVATENTQTTDAPTEGVAAGFQVDESPTTELLDENGNPINPDDDPF